MQRPRNLTLGDKFIVGLSAKGNSHSIFRTGEVVSLYFDDYTSTPKFINDAGKTGYAAFDRLTPFQAPLEKPCPVLTMAVCYQLVQADQFAAMAQAELDNAKEMLENRLHELNQLKAKYNIQ